MQNVQENLEKKIEKLCKFDPLEDGISSIELIRVSGSDLDIVNAARVSYGKVSSEMTERDKKLIAYLVEHEHTSPFEHNQLSFRVKAPLFVVRQWMRHRMHSYNEISYRYVKADLEFYIPKYWRYQDATNRQCSTGEFYDDKALEAYKQSLTAAVQAYETMLAHGIAREQARGVLPLCTYSEFIFTSNLHALMHFLALRLGAGSQYEIRVYAESMLKAALGYFPTALTAWAKKHGYFDILLNLGHTSNN